MADISVRRIDDDVYERLRERAAGNGVSMEEEVRRILRVAVSGPKRLGDLAVTLFGVEHGVDLELPPRDVAEPVAVDE